MVFKEAFKYVLEKTGKSHLTLESVKYLAALASLGVLDTATGIEPGLSPDMHDIKALVTSSWPALIGAKKEAMSGEYPCYKGIYFTRGKCWLKKGTVVKKAFGGLNGYTLDSDYVFNNPIMPIMALELDSNGHFSDLWSALDKYDFDFIDFFYGDEFHEAPHNPAIMFSDVLDLVSGGAPLTSEIVKELISRLIVADDLGFSAHPVGIEAAYLGKSEGYTLVDDWPDCTMAHEGIYVTSGHVYLTCDGEIRDYMNPFEALMTAFACDFNSLDVYLDKLDVDVIKEFYSGKEEESLPNMNDIGIVGLLTKRAETMDTIANAVSRIEKNLGKVDKKVEIVHPFEESYKDVAKFADPVKYRVLDSSFVDNELYPAFECGENILMTGCAGSGKGVLAMTLLHKLAESRPVKYCYLSCHSRMSAADVGWGEDIWGKSKVGALLEGMQQAAKDADTRYVLLLDEVLSANVRSIFGPAMDLLSEKGKSQSYFNQTFTNVDNFQVLATGNLGAMYNGQETIDDAVRSRFHWFVIRGMFQSDDALRAYCNGKLGDTWYAVLRSVMEKCPKLDIDMRELRRYEGKLPKTESAIKDFLKRQKETIFVGDGVARKGLNKLLGGKDEEDGTE